MTFNEFLPIAGLLLLSYICIYSIIARICESFVKCAYYEAYGNYMGSAVNNQSEGDKSERTEE